MTLIMVLLVLGAVLIFLETFLPGLVTGIVGFLCWVAAVILAYRNYGLQTGNLVLGGVLVGLVIGVLCWLKFFPESRIARLFISRSTVGELGVSKPDLVNCTGVTITQLRPSGTAFINGKRTDVVTEGALIEQGASIRVVAVEGMRVVVREL
ncbi:MAG TPA: NfeD family protein [Candidatus Paceibacterota bacterium]|nr:NfeD family protein [Candidatus Paceibacterota bacterium]